MTNRTDPKDMLQEIPRPPDLMTMTKAFLPFQPPPRFSRGGGSLSGRGRGLLNGTVRGVARRGRPPKLSY